MIKPIEILKELIEGTLHTVIIDSVVQNSPNNYTIETCNTFYLNVGKKFTISAVEYTIVSFILNESITFTGASIPVVTEFNIDPPTFVYGTPKFVNIELGKMSDKYPFVWLIEISNTEHDTNPAARIKSTPNYSLLFLDCIDKSRWTIQEHYDNAVYTMQNEAEYIIRVLKRRRDLFESEDLTYETINHANFGDYIANRGYDRKIISDDVSGIQVQLKLPYIVSTCDDGCDEVIVCEGVQILLNGAYDHTEPSGGLYNCVTGGGGTASQTLNGSPLVDQDSGTTKAITIRYANNDPVVVTTVTDTETVFIGEVPDLSLTYDLYFDGVDTGQDVVFDGTNITINLE